MPAIKTMSSPPDSVRQATAAERSPAPLPADRAYDAVAVRVHWVMAVFIVVNLCVGFFMATLANPSPRRNDVLFYHASFGLLILALAVLRVVWRLSHRPAPLPATIPRSQRIAAHAVHVLLYALIVVQPVTGYLHRLAGGHSVSFFGLFDAPVLIARNEPLRVLTDIVHDAGGVLLALLVVGHVAAALKHRYIDRDAVMQRMTG